jgi:signal transduction histidine kinase
MARDLHDTLLQTLQGTKMVADTALDRPGDAPALVRALKQVSAWIGQASEEGRSAVNALRTSTTEGSRRRDCAGSRHLSQDVVDPLCREASVGVVWDRGG